MERRTKPKGCYIGKEDAFQMACAQYLDSIRVLWMHPVNEGQIPVQYRVKLKAKGLKSGAPDVMIFEPSGHYNGLSIELKIWPKKARKEQIEWAERLEKREWKTVKECYGFDDFKKIVDEYLKL